MKKRIIVCGAGIGGLVSAIYLSQNDEYNVEIFEKNKTPGGKIGEIQIEGFRFDTGPVQLLMPDVFRNFFNDINRNIDEYLVLKQLESTQKYFWSDGTVFTAYGDRDRLSAELTKVFGEKERDNYLRYLDYGKLFYDLSKDNLLKEEFKIRNYISRDGIKNITKFISGRSVNDVSNKFFKDQKLKQFMDRYATYNGSSPYLAPQFYSIIPYIENRFGAWYVNGGIYTLALALEKISLENGVVINYGNELIAVKKENRKICGLTFRTDDGSIREENNFDSLVANFTGNKDLTENDYFDNDDWSCSSFSMLIGMDKTFPELSHNNILFSDDYEKEFINIFEKKIPADDMTIQITVSKKTDPCDAPPGCENWLVQVNAPALSKHFAWTEENSQIYKSRILDKIESFYFLFEDSIKKHMRFCKIFTPADFLRKYNSENGSLYGLSSNSLYTLIKRPKNKSARFDNLYFTGGNTNPGGGVPLSFLSGKRVSNMIF